MAEQIIDLPIKKLFNDTEFNSRGHIIPLDVLTLANNIKENGLLQHIIVQPYQPGFSTWTLPEGREYRIVMGHRRYEACKQLGWEKIPAVIKPGLSDAQALALNLIENIERKQLNLLQEAKAIYRFKLMGHTHRQIADEVKMSTGWVQVRLGLLELPVEIQNEAQAGLITTEHIKAIACMTREQQFEAVRQIKDSKLKGQKLIIKVKKKAKVNPKEKKIRSSVDIEAMQDFIIDALGNNLATGALGWAAGYVSNLDLMQRLKIWADQNGKAFAIPPEYFE